MKESARKPRGGTRMGRKPPGRPKGPPRDLALLQTRLPEPLRQYLKALAAYRWGTLDAMFERVFTHFLREKPYEHGLHFRQPRAAASYARGGDSRQKTGWVLVNVHLPRELAGAVRRDAERLEVSIASYLYTALYWWARYVYPPRRPKT